MGKRIDLTGQRFGKYTVVSHAGADKHKHVLWNCICDCGEENAVFATSLTSGKSTQCKKCACTGTEKRLRHGYSRRGQTRYLYRVWSNAKQRCTNPNLKSYHRWGGRGITMFQPWQNSFESFALYIQNALGERPKGRSLDRMDNDGDYRPGNLRWATAKEQAENRRRPQLEMVA